MRTLHRISRNRAFAHMRILAAILLVMAAAALVFLAASPPAAAQPTARMQPLTPKFLTPVAFDILPALRSLPPAARPLVFDPNKIIEVRPERGPEGPEIQSKGYSGDGALQLLSPAPTIPAPLITFEGLSNQDNFNLYGLRVNPPDSDGEVGPNHYVELINLELGVFDKQGNRLLGPTKIGDLWTGFAIPDCTDPSGDPVVVYDQLEDRWLLSQFTTRGPTFYNCVAISQTGDPTGAYFRYAFSTGVNFPDYPKYGLWRNMYIITKPQLPTASFDSIFPCGLFAGQTSRDCLPQPGVAPTANNLLDILSYRQRPTFRLGYRNFRTYESLVTNQSVEALPAVAGARWYEIRRINGTYSIYQQGTYAPGDGVHRWMGSIAQDKNGNMALGYSVVNGVDVFPGIRYTGRLNGDPSGQMTLGEGTIINGSGVQTTTNSRWGDYTDMTVDPTDDCPFWYVNEHYTPAGQASSPAGWQNRIGSFQLP